MFGQNEVGMRQMHSDTKLANLLQSKSIAAFETAKFGHKCLNVDLARTYRGRIIFKCPAETNILRTFCMGLRNF